MTDVFLSNKVLENFQHIDEKYRVHANPIVFIAHYIIFVGLRCTTTRDIITRYSLLFFYDLSIN